MVSFWILVVARNSPWFGTWCRKLPQHLHEGMFLTPRLLLWFHALECFGSYGYPDRLTRLTRPCCEGASQAPCSPSGSADSVSLCPCVSVNRAEGIQKRMAFRPRSLIGDQALRIVASICICRQRYLSGPVDVSANMENSDRCAD